MGIEIPNKVDELRSALLSKGFDEALVASKSKKDLQALYAENFTQEEQFGITFEGSEQTDEEPTKVLTCKADGLPTYGSPEWQSYVLSLMEPNEQMDGFPRCFGLRRVAQLLLGPIVSAKASVVNVIPTEQSRAVTISYEVTFDWELTRPVWIDPRHYVPSLRTFGGVADCVEDTNSPWGRNPAATAETKAMSRALKQALSINVLSAEERVSGYEDGPKEGKNDAPITSQLISFIEAKVNTLKLNLSDVMKEGGLKTTVLKDLSLEEGRQLFAFINKYQQKGQ